MKPILLSTLTGCLLLSAAMAGETGPAAIAPAGGNGQPPYSWRGINGSGVFPAQDIVTEFHDLAADVVATTKDAGARGVYANSTSPARPAAGRTSSGAPPCRTWGKIRRWR